MKTALEVAPFGPEAALVTPDSQGLDALARAALVHGLARALRRSFPGIRVVAGGCSVLVARPAAELGAADLDLDFEASVAPREHTFETVYDGPDLAEVARATGLHPSEWIARHSAPNYTCLLAGFLPGFGYLGELDPTLRMPRRASPRARVTPGSVAIAVSFTGIYPSASPGGWHCVGRVPSAELFSPERDPPALLQPLDRVRFVPRESVRENPQRTAPPIVPRDAALAIGRAAGWNTIVDRGRTLDGLPVSGPLDEGVFEAANQAVSNAPGCACIEVFGGTLEVEVLDHLLVSVDGSAARAVSAGDRLVVRAEARSFVRYLAIAGGVDVPLVLGSRSTLSVAGFGGFCGRPLRRGDLVGVDRSSVATRSAGSPAVRAADESVIELVVHPVSFDDRLDPHTLDLLSAGTYRVSRALDRVGVRLEGPALPRASLDFGLPDPVLPGAVQITTDGTPIVLGPDAAVTGGYPVVGVLDRTSRAALARQSPGSEVRFERT
ncbi:MAG: carboxyltransferase domain-containing protein [Polyangiaceae bacterium]